MLLVLLTFSGKTQTNQLLVTTKTGGDYNNGVILLADTDGTNFHKVYSFIGPEGRWPIGKSAVDANGIVYGVTEFGGLGDSCTVYSFNVQTNDCQLLHDFYATIDSGWWDVFGPTLLPDGMLYGTTTQGGRYGKGSIYRLNTSTHHFEDLYDLDTLTLGAGAGALYYATDGKLYGMTSSYGLNGSGTIFSLDPVTQQLDILYNMIDSMGHGAAGTFMQGSDGKIYGTTSFSAGFSFSYGTIFSFDLTSHVYKRLHKFDLWHGCFPNGALVQAPNDKLYGLCRQGGQSYGVLFSYDLQTDSFKVLHNFVSATGERPLSTLTLATNGKLYGTASEGGTHNAGVAFSYDINDSLYSVIFNFDSVNGARPAGTIIETNPHLNNTTSVLPAKQDVSFRIMPNPASSHAVISSSQPVINISVTDMKGAQVITAIKQISPNTYQLDGLDLLPNGIYFVKADMGKYEQVRRLTIHK